MDNKLLATESLDEFIDALSEMRGLIALDKHLLHLLFEIKNDVPLQTQKFLTLCLSLLDDGNTRIALDAKQFSATWAKKWNGLVTLRISSTDEEMSESDFATASDFDEIISGVEFAQLANNLVAREAREEARSRRLMPQIAEYD